jgi:hypothetical protein
MTQTMSPKLRTRTLRILKKFTSVRQSSRLASSRSDISLAMDPKSFIEPEEVASYFKKFYKPSTCKPFDEFENVTLKPERLDERFMQRITRQEVRRIFQHAKNTASGEDRIRYNELRNIDPSFYLLTLIFNRCMKEQRIPSHWKRAYTILIHMKGDESRIDNWRPIALTDSIYKVYTGIWAQRLQQLSELISSEQKGFCSLDGAGEHTALFRHAIH